jgi:hypothetical protein
LTTVRAAPGLVGLARRRFRAGGRSSVFRLAGFCKPALSPLRIVAQHWATAVGGDQAIGQCRRVQRVREPPQPRGVIVGRCACPSRPPSLRSAPAAPLTAALRCPEAAAKRSGEVCAKMLEDDPAAPAWR